jgi:hypothetical protein
MFIGREIHNAGGDRYLAIACFAGAIGLPVFALVLVVYQTTRNLRSHFVVRQQRREFWRAEARKLDFD